MILRAKSRDKGAGEAKTEAFPLTEMQKFMLPTLTDPDCVLRFKQFFYQVQGLRIKPGVPPRRIERGLKKLVKRHDVLRLAFRKSDDGEWQGVLVDPDEIKLTVEDYGTMEPEALRAKVREVANTTMEIDDEILTDFRMLRFGEEGDAILFRLHHALTDAFGMMVLSEDLVKFIVNLPNTGNGYSYGNFVSEVEDKLPDHDGEAGAYWDNLLFPPPAPVNFGRVAKDLSYETDPHLIDDIRDHSEMMSVEDFEEITEIAQKAGASMFTLVVATLNDVMHDMYGADGIIGRSVMGRNAGDLTNFIGFALRFPLWRVNMADGDTLIDRAKTLRTQMQTSMTMVTKELGRPVNAVDSRLRAETGIGVQFFVHVPSADAKAKSSMMAGLFRSQGDEMMKVGPVEVERIALPRPPAMGAPNELTVLVLPFDDGAQVTLRCDGTVFDDDELGAIAGKLMEKLLSVKG